MCRHGSACLTAGMPEPASADSTLNSYLFPLYVPGFAQQFMAFHTPLLLSHLATASSIKDGQTDGIQVRIGLVLRGLTLHMKLWPCQLPVHVGTLAQADTAALISSRRILPAAVTRQYSLCIHGGQNCGAGLNCPCS